VSTWRALRWNFSLWEILVLSPFLLLGCGSKWTAADASNAKDSANLQLQMETICGREDAGPTCQPAAVRAMERGSYCATASMLSRHGSPVPASSTIHCQAP
jgi:hypothetical protein